MGRECTVDYIDHVGVAVRDLESAMAYFCDVFGIQPGEVKDLSDQGVKATLLTLGQTRLELLEPLNDATTVGRFIERRGEGLHHVAFNVKNVGEALDAVKTKGLRVIDNIPREGLSGLIAFIHPNSTHGILTELVENS